MTIVAVITLSKSILSGTPEHILSTGAHSTHVLENMLPDSIATAITAILEQHAIRTSTPLVIGHPSNWPLSFSKSLQQLLNALPKVSAVFLLDNALLCAFGCARSNALVIEKAGPHHVVAPVLDYSVSRLLNSEHDDLWTAIDHSVSLVDADKRPLLFDNLIIMEGNHTNSEKVVTVIKERIAVSSFAADSQFRTVNVRGIPEYHSELFKNCHNLHCGLFGVAISCKSIIQELSK